ncbi:MAG TPA: lysophospholipid acyltransferase family protein, partial [Opitutaceae bacterium]
MTEKSGVLRAIVRGWVRFYYPRIEVTGGDLIPREGPVLLAANHPNSLIDPVMLGIAARRPVRLMAKATLFSTPVFGSLLRALGMVPAYRGSDDARQVSKNLESLAAAGRQVAAGGAMGIFPEGKSHDAAQLALVRSGAARLAMQAAAAGARGLKVVPIGLNYERKERFRSAVWIKVGRPIDVDTWLRMHGGDEHLAMRTMTQEISARLKRCVVHLDNAAWENLLDEVEALLPVADGPAHALARLHQRKRVADAINHAHRADPARAEAAAQRVHAHAKTLDQAGVTADALLLQRSGWQLAVGVAWGAVKFLLNGVVGLIGILHHAVPYALVRLIAGRLPASGRMVVAL